MSDAKNEHKTTSFDHRRMCTCAEPGHGYHCARCHEVYCLACDQASDATHIKTIVRYCRNWRCQRERKIEEFGHDPAELEDELAVAIAVQRQLKISRAEGEEEYEHLVFEVLSPVLLSTSAAVRRAAIATILDGDGHRVREALASFAAQRARIDREAAVDLVAIVPTGERKPGEQGP